MNIGPHDTLEPGTKVKVQNRVGTVDSWKIVPAHPTGTIVVHTITLTHKIERGIGRETKVVPLPRPDTIKPNYSFVEVYS